jgi:hypothetical protein
MPKEEKQNSYSKSVRRQKVTSAMLFSNTPKKSLERLGLSKKESSVQLKKHIKSLK